MQEKFNYNYVICGAGGYYNIGYRDIMNLPNVNYYESYNQGIQTTWIQRLVRLTFSKKANQYVRTPFSKITYPRIYKPKFEDNKPLCFLFFLECAIRVSNLLLVIFERYLSQCENRIIHAGPNL